MMVVSVLVVTHLVSMTWLEKKPVMEGATEAGGPITVVGMKQMPFTESAKVIIYYNLLNFQFVLSTLMYNDVTI